MAEMAACLSRRRKDKDAQAPHLTQLEYKLQLELLSPFVRHERCGDQHRGALSCVAPRGENLPDKLKLELHRLHPPECAPWMQRRVAAPTTPMAGSFQASVLISEFQQRFFNNSFAAKELTAVLETARQPQNGMTLLTSRGKPVALLVPVTAESADELAEYGEVCARPELPLSEPARQQLLHALRGLPLLPLPPLTTAAPRCPDRDDQPFLTAACHYRADYLITGNTKHFSTTLAPPPHIVTPRAWLALVL